MYFPLSPLPKKVQYYILGFYVLTFLFFLLTETGWIDTVYHFPVHNGGDSGGYFLLAKHILSNHAFTYSQNAPYILESLRSPGYPLFISIVIGIFRAPELISVIQLILSFFTGWLIYDILNEKLSVKYSLLGATLFWLNPTVLFYSITALSDALFVFLEILIFWILWKRSSVQAHILAFALLGFATLVRPAGSYLGFILIVWMSALLWKELPVRSVALRILLVSLTSLCIVTPWMYRNYQAFGNFEISSVGPYTLLFYDMEALKESHGESRENIEAPWLQEIGAPSREAVSSSKYSQKTMSVFKRELFSNLTSYTVFETKGIIQFFLGSGFKDVSQNTLKTNDFLSKIHMNRSIDLLAWIERILMLCLTLLFIISPFLVYKDRKHLLLILGSGVIALYMAVVVGPIPNPRYRLAALPFILIPAITSLSILSKKHSSQTI